MLYMPFYVGLHMFLWSNRMLNFGKSLRLSEPSCIIIPTVQMRKQKLRTSREHITHKASIRGKKPVYPHSSCPYAQLV